MRQWVCGLLLLSGCQSVYYEFDKGYVSSALTMGRVGKHPLEALIGRIHIVGEDNLWGPINYDFGAGPMYVIPTDGKSNAFGFDIATKLILVKWAVEPYLEIGTGYLYMAEKWEEQATNYGFTLQGGIGVRYQMPGQGKVGIAYRQWHESNGNKIFGSPRPNPGFEAGGLFLSYEVGF